MSLPDVHFAELAAQPVCRRFAFPATRTVEPVRAIRPDRANAGATGMLDRDHASTSRRTGCFASLSASRTIRRSRARPRPAGKACSPDRCSRRTPSCACATASSSRCSNHRREFQEAAAACRNVGTWPVLAGEAGERDTVLSSPIILYDYPQIAPESPGDLFDGAEIDEILSLRILTLDRRRKERHAPQRRARPPDSGADRSASARAFHEAARRAPRPRSAETGRPHERVGMATARRQDAARRASWFPAWNCGPATGCGCARAPAAM